MGLSFEHSQNLIRPVSQTTLGKKIVELIKSNICYLDSIMIIAVKSHPLSYMQSSAFHLTPMQKQAILIPWQFSIW